MNSQLHIYIGLPRFFNKFTVQNNIIILDSFIKSAESLKNEIINNGENNKKGHLIYEEYIDINDAKTVYYEFNEKNFNGPDKDIYLGKLQNLKVLNKSERFSITLNSLFIEKDIKIENYKKVSLFIHQGNPINIIKSLRNFLFFIDVIEIHVPCYETIWINKIKTLFKNNYFINNNTSNNIWNLDYFAQRKFCSDLLKQNNELTKKYKLLNLKISKVKKEIKKIL